jgi:hypothetical protein
MHLDIVEALQKGFNRTFEKNGLMIAGLLFITSMMSTVLSATLSAQSPGQTQTAAAPSVLALPISPMIAGILLVPVSLASMIVGLVAIRTFVSDETETIPEEFYKENLLSALLNMIVGGIVFALALVAILFVPVIPGAALLLSGMSTIGAVATVIGALIGFPILVYLALSLYFWTFYVAVEDQNFIEGFKSSWELTEGHKLGLLVLAVAIFVVSLIVNLIGSAPAFVGLSLISTILGVILGAFTSAFGTATLAQAYNQLK